jgi:predicted DCC family thiol-disulfide oxidoreductase YuxK
MDEEPKYPITIFYDGACSICRREMERYRAKDKNTKSKPIIANHSNFDPKNEGLDPQKILDYIYAKDQNGKVVYSVEAFVWIWEACGYKFLPILVRLPLIKQLARAFYRLFARYRYKISREKLVCGPECDHKMI